MKARGWRSARFILGIPQRITGSMERLAYYITSHGFGHAVRSLEVIRQLLVQEPRLQITVVSDIPEDLVEQ